MLLAGVARLWCNYLQKKLCHELKKKKSEKEEVHLGPAASALMMWLARKLADIQRCIEIYTTYTLSFLYLDSPSAGFILLVSFSEKSL